MGIRDWCVECAPGGQHQEFFCCYTKGMKGVPNASLITSLTPKGQQGGCKAQYGQVRIGTGGGRKD